MFDLPDPTELQLPTDTAPVPVAAVVTCVHCAREVRLGDSDVVGLGYRCAACSTQAELGELAGRPDVADHLTPSDRDRFARAALDVLRRAVLVTAVVVIGSIGLFLVTGSLPVLEKILTVVLAFGITAAFALGRWRRFRR
jgi:hypothetical protein